MLHEEDPEPANYVLVREDLRAARRPGKGSARLLRT
jgi:hypothetical protein